MLNIFKSHSVFIILLNIFLVWGFDNILGQNHYSGYIFDISNQKPLDKAVVKIPGTDIIAQTNPQGYFYLNPDLITSLIGTNKKAIFSYNNRELEWTSTTPVAVMLFDINGKNCGGYKAGTSTSGQFKFPNLNSGSYFLRLASPRTEKTIKVLVLDNQFFFNTNELGIDESIQLQITRDGYESQTFYLNNGDLNYYFLKNSNNKTYDYLSSIPDLKTFENYEGKPLNNTYNEVTSVKFVYEIQSSRILYINANRFLYHFEFAYNILGYNKGLNTFNLQQYTNNSQRQYILGSINHYLSSDIYTIEFFASDELNCSQIQTIYNKISTTCFFGETIKFYPNTSQWESCTNVPIIKSEELFNGQDYQSLNPGITYGYLKKVDMNEVSATYLGRHDIALVNGIPNDIPVVAGIITTQFQTPLSHINILSRNRKTPNMALRSGWNNEMLNYFEGKLIRLEVDNSNYSVRETSVKEAETFWSAHEPSVPVKLELDTLTSGLIDLKTSGLSAVKTIGGKSANFAELRKISSVPVPEGSFAIPFFYYQQHLQQNGLVKFIQKTLQDPLFRQDVIFREQKLEEIRDTIKSSVLDPVLLKMVSQKLLESGFQAYRFRSSTNAEDVEGFNGAGLYDSYTGIPGDTGKSIEKAIKKVWASLWNFRAFEERDYFRIDHFSIAMAILVHRSFPTEDVNGVIITTNLYNIDIPAYTINSQFLEFSVVRPENDILPEHVLYYTMEEPYKNRIEYINKSNLPGKPTELVLSEQEIINLAKVCKAIEDHYCNKLKKCYPLDIEFKIDSSVSGVRKLYIKQARPFKQ